MTEFRQIRKPQRHSAASAMCPTEFWRKSILEQSALVLPYPIHMATIRRLGIGASTRVTVSGRLSAADMGRLEHACSPALTDRAAALDIDLRRVTDIDPTARAVLHRLETRGARLFYPPHGSVTRTAGDGGPAVAGRDRA